MHTHICEYSEIPLWLCQLSIWPLPGHCNLFCLSVVVLHATARSCDAQQLITAVILRLPHTLVLFTLLTGLLCRWQEPSYLSYLL